ncbi:MULTISPECIES: hypothetical protein [unclassified Colwellia]|uniref:hypothetical protein n=1 Tax=unclassified Colwellia TaxID=196834 RepID=UPI0015F3F1E7|nr:MULTISPECIES: hypothetical protein [unclassified Colwellia]MBA6225360.1 hypothetical protein [Colwellia sp. MB3u-45]MBA6267190.1 hypothetical protein [Colwellia sp. MB3u-43]MBA6289992.1 hypothetical protein [Colwellia sp. MB3u-4]MBA6322802.1 hypothetical protein [Colwellia sp. MB02u-19]MBA6324790.1 hypothetical protein [Colwellia sp. MB02u-18]
MNINITFVGELIFYSMFIVGGLSYYLGKRKTSNPKIATIIGVALCITPPLNLVYLIVLMLKNDIVVNKELKTTI